MTVRKIFIKFCKNIKSFVMKSINVQGNFVLCRVEFYKIGKRDATFIREMRVIKTSLVILSHEQTVSCSALTLEHTVLVLRRRNVTLYTRWMSFKDNQPNPEAENMPMQYARYIHAYFDFKLHNRFICHFLFAIRSKFLDCMWLFCVTFEMFLNNLTPYKFNIRGNQKRVFEEK